MVKKRRDQPFPLKYKNFVGIVEYDAEGKIFTGEVLGLRDVITFQGRTPRNSKIPSTSPLISISKCAPATRSRPKSRSQAVSMFGWIPTSIASWQSGPRWKKPA